MSNITVKVRDKRASTVRGAFIVADNTDYRITFDFDAEWSAHASKTCRILIGTQYTEIDFTGSFITVPSLPSSVDHILVGVFAGDLETTTPARIPVLESILGRSGTEYTPSEPSVLPDIDALAPNDTFTVNDVSEGKKARATIEQIAACLDSASSTTLNFVYSSGSWVPQFSWEDLSAAYTAWAEEGKRMAAHLSGAHFTAGEIAVDGEITLTHFDMVDFDYVFSDAIAVGAEDPEERGECEQIMLELHFARRIDPEEGDWIDEVSNGWLIASKLATADELAAGLEVKYTKPPGGIPTIDLADADKFDHMPESVGFGRGVVLSQPSAAGVYAVSISNYTERNGGFVAVNFNSHAVSAGASLKINSNSAHPIYHMGAAIAADIIKRSDTALLLYNASIYHLIAIDRRAKTDDIPMPSDSAPQALAETASAGDSVFYSRANHKHPLPSASDVGALPDDTAIPGALSDLTDDAAHRTVTDTEKATWGGKADRIERVTVSTAGAVSQALDAGKLYHFTGALTSLTITFNAASGVAQYHFDFTEGSTAFDPTLPSGVVLPDGHTWEADTHYEVDILNNYAVVVGWAVS